MIFPIQPPVAPANSSATTPVNTVVTIQAISNVAAIGEGSGGGANPLSTLANGTTVQGFVVNRDAQNNPILRTAIGDLRVTSDVFLKTGSEVTIRVDNTLATLARIIAVDGLTPQDYNNQTQAARAGITKDTISASGLQPLLTNASTTPTKLGAPSANPILQAIVLQGQPASVAPSLLTAALAASQSGPVQALAQLAQLRAGTPIRLTVLDLKLPPIAVALGALPQSDKLDGLLPPRLGAPATPSSAPQAPQQLGTTPQTNANSSITPIAGQAAAPVTATGGNEIDPAQADEVQGLQTLIAKKSEVSAAIQTVKSVDPLLKSVPSAQNAPNAVGAQPSAERPALSPTAPNQISASVIGHDADGANILHTPFATLKVYTPQPLPTGTTLLVSANVETDNALIAPATLAEEQLASIAPQSDKAIDDVLAWIIANQPDAARQLQQQLPDIHRNLASGLLFFIAAIKGGDMGKLIGKQGLRALESSAPELLARMRAEVGQIQANIVDSPLSHWTLYPLSMMTGHEMQHARLYVGKDPNDSASAQGDTSRGQRFVLEVELSQLGAMQFDGFVRSNAEGKKSFDLMVRSAQPLDDALSHEIRTIFDTTAAITGLTGRLIFQEGNQHFVRPMADTKTRTGGDGLNTILA